jgi:hypothetical protein
MTVPDDAGDGGDGRDGRGALRAHMIDAELPRELAERVRRSLESRGLVKATASRRPWTTRAALIAAGIVLGILGRDAYLETRESLGASSISAPASQYVLLLYGAPPGDTGVVHAAREREYGRWASALDGGARWVGGNELHDVIAQLGGPPSGTGGSVERLAGYFIIAAPSAQRATEVARTCPHLKYGGRIVVMTIAS